MTDTTPDYAGLSRSLGALAYHIQQTGTADGQDAQTCLEVAEALRTLLESNKALMRERTNLIETKREQIDRLNTRIAELERERDAWRKECEKLSTVWAENHSRNKRAEDAEARVKELEKALAAVKKMYAHEGAKALHELERAEAAEAKLAEAIKVLDAIDRVNRGVDWCDQYEQARRWFAARKFLKENGNGE